MSTTGSGRPGPSQTLQRQGDDVMNSMRTIVTHAPEFSGMALGGIGAGTVEIFPDGRLENWNIWNLGKWASRSPEQDNLQEPAGLPGELLRFYLRTSVPGGEPLVRKLSYDGPQRQGQFRSAMYSWMKCIPEIAWTPSFPAAQLEYRDPALPVELSAEYISPFLPHNARVSGTPGFCVSFRLRNRTQSPVSVSLLGLLENPVCRGMARRRLYNRISQDGGAAALTMESRSEEKVPLNGSLSLLAEGGEHSYLLGEFEAYLNAYVLSQGMGATEESCLFQFREEGRLPNLGWEELPDFSRFTPEHISAMAEDEVEQWTAVLLRSAWGAGPWKRLSQLRPCPIAGVEGKRKFLVMMANQYRKFSLPGREERGEWGGGGLCSTAVLQPGETATLRFFLGWHFPYHVSPTGQMLGHQYGNWFRDSQEVCRFLAENQESIFPKAREFSSLLGQTDAPAAFSRGWTAHLNTLLKCSWWTGNGDFGIWEGFGSCGFHTTDISYHGSWGLLALFPELQCRQMRMGASFQREDGRVPHFFTPDFSGVDDGFDRVDMNPQFVLMVCRDYLWTGDRRYLAGLWPHVVRAIESTALLDEDGDGLPDAGTDANTYDAWKFQGTPSYIAFLWLGALTAAVRLAEEAGQAPLAQKWKALLEKGSQSAAKLWNGGYYSLWVNGEARDECCMSDQLDGLWYTTLLGLPPFLQQDTVSKTLDSILKWNFSRENGLINASYPPGAVPTLFTYQNVQALANWSGIEYAFASLLLEQGRFEAAAQLAGAVEERYWYAGRIFNHEECGDYYYRPLSSWTMMLSLSHFRLDAPQSRLQFTLEPSVHIVPWFSPTGCGTLRRGDGTAEIACLEGKLPVAELFCGNVKAVKAVSLNGRPLPFTQKGNGWIQTEASLHAGDRLVLSAR